MKFIIMFVCILYRKLLLAYAICDNDYFSKRNLLIRTELYETLGGNIPLNDKEQIVNNCLMQQKFKEINYAFDNPQYFNLSRHYFAYKNQIRESKVYKIIQRMPKGAALHIHDLALMGPDYILNITYMDNLYVCFCNDKLHLQFSNRLPTQNCEHWQLMSKARHEAKNVTKFDSDLRKHFTIVVDDPEVVYPSINESWDALQYYFTTVSQILTYRPVWEQYFYDALKTFREDNILYLEVRTVLPQLYELDGTEHDQHKTAKTYEKTIKRFVKDYPDFIGAKIIF